MNVISTVSSKFRAQPLIRSDCYSIEGLEILSRERMQFDDVEGMLRIDIDALKSAALLSRYYRHGLRIHINVEITSMMDVRWWDSMVGILCPGIVVEIVERNYLLSHDNVMNKAVIIANAIRNRGGEIALDDLTGTPLEARAVKMLQPEIIKIDYSEHIEEMRRLPCRTLVVERIDSVDAARKAARLGADELQGYWCDIQKEEDIPRQLTPPGLDAMNVSVAHHMAETGQIEAHFDHVF